MDIEDSVDTVDVIESDDDCKVMKPPSSTQSTCAKKRKTSDVWNEFEIVLDGNGKERALCMRCKTTSYAYGSSSHGTKNMKRHMEKCPKRDNNDVEQLVVGYGNKLQSRKVCQATYREKMAIGIIKHNYPYSIVEHEGIRDVHSYLNHEAKSYTRNTAKADCLKIYRREKERIKLVLNNVPGRICLTSDIWTSSTTEGYICLTAHYIDENWVLHSKILNFCHFPPPHTGVLLSEKIFNFLKEWGIDRKVFSLTLDNASNNDKMEDILKSQLCVQNALLCGGDFFHVRCCAHILNLIVQEGLKVAKVALHKIRESVKYIKGTEGKRIKFSELADQIGVRSSMGLRMDVPTRWNSTFLMLESALIYRRVFIHLSLIDQNYIFCPSNEEWDRGERICKFLKPFYDITTLFSGSTYPTANLYFQNVWKIQLRLNEEAESEDEIVSAMAKQMKPKFLKYWDSYSVVLAIATILDPRYKFSFVEFCYKKVDHLSLATTKLGVVKRELYKLFEAYEVLCSKEVPESASVATSVSGPSSFEDDICEFDHYESEFNTIKKSELDHYLEEPRFDRTKYQDMEILNHWKKNQDRYPILAVMARDIMTIPITTVASESAFSIGSKVLNKYRSSLRPENAQSLICTRTWLCGYEMKDDDEIDDDYLLVPLTKTGITESRESANTTVVE